METDLPQTTLGPRIGHLTSRRSGAVATSVREERAKTRAWLHDRILQILEYVASGGYEDDPDVEHLRRVAALGADPTELSEALQQFAGVGSWTAGYVLMRVLGSPDVLLSTDIAVRKGAQTLGIPPENLITQATKWRPWRSYANLHLWRAT